MKIVTVTYTSTAEFSAQNQLNINKVMNELREAAHQGIQYFACLSADNKTFIHTAFFKSDEDQQLLNALPSFKNFQEQLKLSGLEVAPKQELLSLVAANFNLF